MLTHLEVDGFKNLLDFSVDFGPYTCIAGPNAIGKSNIFDAIGFLALLADNTFIEAAQELRTPGTRVLDLASLFWAGVKDGARMRFTAEFIVDREVRDDFGRDAEPTATFLRYELVLGCESATDPLGGDQIRLVREDLRHIALDEAAEKIPWAQEKKAFRDLVIRSRRRAVPYISTADDGTVEIHQDGGSGGLPRRSPAGRAPRTIVSTTTTSETPTVLAARREMQSWQALALEPSALRQPDNLTGPDVITRTGAHMPAALRRIAIRGGRDAAAGVTSTAAGLTDIRSVSVDADPGRQTLTLRAANRSGYDLPSWSLSDGTLRFLALAIIANDPQHTGLICLEEPENGIHPARIDVLVDLVRGIAVDPDEPLDDDNPLRQVIVNTHSPAFVSAQHADDLLFAVGATIIRDNTTATTIRLVPLLHTWRHGLSERALAKADIKVFLGSGDHSQLALELAGAGRP